MHQETREISPSSQEYQLLEYAQRVARRTEKRRAICVHLSRLRSVDLREHHMRVAMDSFEGLARQFEGTIFKMASGDLVLVCRGASIAELDQMMGQLRYLFGDDPAAQGGGVGTDEFSTWFDLEIEYDHFLDFATKLQEDAARRQTRLTQIGTPRQESKRPPITARGLQELIDTIASADLTNVMRRQAVYALTPDKAPQVLFRELYISIADLQAQVVPKYDILADRWLFQHLTERLDRRMIALLKRNDDASIATAFSINLNISTVLSPDFLAFDGALRASARGTVIVEFQPVDVFSNLEGFAFARDFLRSRRYRLCLDGVTEAMLPLVDRERLGVDMVKVVWSPAMAEASQSTLDAIGRIGKPRTILSRCGSKEALAFGLSRGLAMFQGRFADQLAAAKGAA